MGIKSLTLQMIPWCFHVLGGTTACHHPDPPASPAATKAITPTTTTTATGKAPLCIRLIKADGRVEVYRRPVNASELMRAHPMHLVCRSDAFTIGQRIPALGEGEQLQPGHAYFLLPLHVFQSVLSFVTLAASFARAAAAASSSNGSASPLLQRPFDVHRTPSGRLQIRICDEFIRRIQEAQEGGDGVGGAVQGSGGGGRVCTTAALEKDYRQLVVGCRERQWKPTLETIRESERRRGKLMAVGGAAGALDGIRRRRKKGHQHQGEPHGDDRKQQLQEQQQQQRKQKKQIHKVSTVAKNPNASPSHKSKGKKRVARHLFIIRKETQV